MSQAGKTRRCECGAAWVPDASLVEMADAVSGGIVAIPWKPRKGEARACPTCGDAMEAVSVKNIALDRCDKDGVWFDADELQRLLLHASKFPKAKVEDRFPTSTVTTVTTTQSPDVDVAVDTAVVAVVAVDAGLGILDLLSALFD
jgi:Transcription factor zinc-finger